jgi:predicted ATPase
VVEAAGLRGWRALHDLLAEDRNGTRPLGEIAEAIELPADPAASAALFTQMRRLFETLASKHHLIVIFEDLHWAEPPVLDLFDHLAGEARGPILLVGLARPDVLEQRPEWGQDAVELGPLSSTDVKSLLLERAGQISHEALRRIVEVSQGNPLFAEQLLAAIDDAPEAVPDSLRGLLTMRLDRLGPGERDVLRCASIAGREVELVALRALSRRCRSLCRAPPRRAGAQALDRAGRLDRGPLPPCTDQAGRLSEHDKGGSRPPSRTVRRMAR